MRQTAGTLNRIWLAVIGLILLLAGLVATAIAIGVATRLLTAVGAGVSGPQPNSPVVGPSVGPLFGATWMIVLVGIIGLIWPFWAWSGCWRRFPGSTRPGLFGCRTTSIAV